MCVEFATVGALSGLGKTQLCGLLSIALTSTSIVKGIIFTATILWITRNNQY